MSVTTPVPATTSRILVTKPHKVPIIVGSVAAGLLSILIILFFVYYRRRTYDFMYSCIRHIRSYIRRIYATTENTYRSGRVSSSTSASTVVSDVDGFETISMEIINTAEVMI